MADDDRRNTNRDLTPFNDNEPTTLAEEAQASIDSHKDPASDALQSFADIIQEKAGPVSNGMPADIGTSAAEQVEHVADFVYERRPSDAVASAWTFLQQQPLAGVAIGVALGFAIGRLSK